MAKPPRRALVNKALHGELTRSNTQVGTEQRRAVYASEYQQRSQRAQLLGLNYSQARQLRAAFPLSSASRQELHRNHLNVGQEHTRYAVIRAQVIRAEQAHGKHPGKKKVRAARYVQHLPTMPYPTAELAAWYRKAWGSDYDPRAFARVAGGPQGPAPSEAPPRVPTEAAEGYTRELIDYAEGEGISEEQYYTEHAPEWERGLEPTFEDYYGDFDTDEWDVWEFGEY